MMEPRDRINLVGLCFAGAATLLLIIIYGTLLRDVIHQASVRGPVDSATLGAIGALGPLVGGAVTGMFALLNPSRSGSVTVDQPPNDPIPVDTQGDAP